MHKHPRRAVLLAAAALAAGGCMGQFQLTRRLYAFNETLTGSSFINHLVFWALAIVLPVYGLAILGDALIFNLLEYWTGSNVLAGADAADGGERRVVVEPRGDGSLALIVGDRCVVATADGEGRAVVRDAAGALLGAIERRGDTIVVTSAAHAEPIVLYVEEAEAAARALQQRAVAA